MESQVLFCEQTKYFCFLHKDKKGFVSKNEWGYDSCFCFFSCLHGNKPVCDYEYVLKVELRCASAIKRTSFMRISLAFISAASALRDRLRSDTGAAAVSWYSNDGSKLDGGPSRARGNAGPLYCDALRGAVPKVGAAIL
jgi:hypothetical protein